MSDNGCLNDYCSEVKNAMKGWDWEWQEDQDPSMVGRPIYLR